MYNDIIKLLDQHRMKEAFVQLIAYLSEADKWDMKSEADTLLTTYQYMLQYAAQGTKDPEREQMYGRIRRSLYTLADRVKFVHDLHDGTGYNSSNYRLEKMSPSASYAEQSSKLESVIEDIGVSDLMASDEKKQKKQAASLNKKKEEIIDILFNKIRLSDAWNDEHLRVMNAMLDSVLLPANVLAILVSAVTMNLLTIFDHRKFQFLINAYQRHTELIITQRALTGLALAIYYQEERLKLYPELTAELSLMADDPNFLKQLHTIQILLLLSRETERINRLMKEGIIPQMINATKKLNTDMKISEIDIEDLVDKNPEWEKDMESIADSIRELGELQMEGADTYMSTFAELKTYNFFTVQAHWFYPFDKETSVIAPFFDSHQVEEKSMLNIMISSPTFCNSDKYSFCLALFSLPEKALDGILRTSESADEKSDSMMKALGDPSLQESEKLVAKMYIHDLYRFFKLWKYRSEEHDIFSDDLAFWKNKLLRPMIFAGEYQKKLADFLFSKDYFDEAIEIYQELAQEQQLDPDVWQKLGFSYQKVKKYAEAIKAYKQADLLKPDHVWTLKHIAQCDKRMGLYAEALEYFQRVEAVQPDNLNLALQIGQCLAALRQYKNALTYFFKVEYLDKAPANARRAIGWCYFMTGKYAEAHRFYEKLLAGEPLSSDWLNNGHVYLAETDIPKALDCYREVHKQCPTHEDFLKLYLADMESLKEQGVNETSIYLIPDALLDNIQMPER